jgi:hypothetical protein
MALQYVIDSICASVTVECVYKIIEALLSQGTFTLAEMLPLIQSKDRSLDLGSARMIANELNPVVFMDYPLCFVRLSI